MIAGPFESHIIGGRRFVCDSEDTATLQLQGRDNEVKQNGDGTLRNTQKRVPGIIEGTNIVFHAENGDDDFLLEKKNDGKFIDYSGTTNDGLVIAGSIQITGELKFNYKDGTVPITFTGTFQKQG
jgi:hypothetical protein